MKMKNTLLVIAVSSVLAACGSSSSQGTVNTSSGGSTSSGSTSSGSTSSGSTSSGSTSSGSTSSGSTSSGSTSSGSTSSGSTSSGSTSSGSTSSGSTSSGSTSSGSTSTNLTGYNGTKIVANSSGSVKSHTTFKAKSNVNQLVLNGKTIDLIPSGFSVGGFFTLGEGSNVNGDTLVRKVSGSNYASRFGVIVDGSEVTAFSQGDVTSNMPSSGTAEYKGDYAGYEHQSGEMGRGTITATVDFAKKTMSGSVSEDTSNSFSGGDFSGVKISGNTFSFSDGDVQAKGAFYGDKAAELGGTYSNGSYTAGFGAKKQ